MPSPFMARPTRTPYRTRLTKPDVVARLLKTATNGKATLIPFDGDEPERVRQRYSKFFSLRGRRLHTRRAEKGWMGWLERA